MIATTNLPTALEDPAVNMARQALYRFSALLLLDPRAGGWQQLSAFGDDSLLDEAATLIRSLPETRTLALAPGEQPVDLLDQQHVPWAAVVQQPEQLRPSKASPTLVFDIPGSYPKPMCRGEGIQRSPGAISVLFSGRCAKIGSNEHGSVFYERSAGVQSFLKAVSTEKRPGVPQSSRGIPNDTA